MKMSEMNEGIKFPSNNIRTSGQRLWEFLTDEKRK